MISLFLLLVVPLFLLLHHHLRHFLLRLLRRRGPIVDGSVYRTKLLYAKLCRSPWTHLGYGPLRLLLPRLGIAKVDVGGDSVVEYVETFCIVWWIDIDGRSGAACENRRRDMFSTDPFLGSRQTNRKIG